MELFDTHFVWFGQVLVISGLKMLVLYNRYKKADAIVSYSNVHVAESCVCIVTWDCKGHTVEYTFCNSSCNFPPMLRISLTNFGKVAPLSQSSAPLSHSSAANMLQLSRGVCSGT